MSPKEVIINKATGRVSHLILARTEQDEATGEWKIDDEETLKKVGYVTFFCILLETNQMSILDTLLIIVCWLYKIEMRLHYICIWLHVVCNRRKICHEWNRI